MGLRHIGSCRGGYRCQCLCHCCQCLQVMITWIIIKLRNTTIVMGNALQYERSNQIQQFKSFAEPEAEVGSGHDCHHCHNSSLDITLDKTKRWVIVKAEL